MASFTAAGTVYATWGEPMIPFFIFYSMFGFQRVGDLIWSFGDQRGRGFLLGATAGRTTLAGEGLQHCDGQSQLLASAYPNCRAYDPAFAYEMGVIIRDGIERMYGDEPEDCFYYLTLYNENYSMPAMPEGVEEGIVRGLYRFREAPAEPRCATARRSSPAAPRCSRRSTRSACSPTSGTSASTCGARRRTSCSARTRCPPNGGTACTPPSRRARRTSPSCCGDAEGPVVAVTDFMKAVPDGVGRFVPEAVRRTRHRRLRLLRHARRAAASLRGRRAEHRRRGAAGSRADRRDQGRGRARSDRPLRHRPRQGRPAPHLIRSS